MKRERNSNFELLRIVAMLMIIMTHIIWHGNTYQNGANNGFLLMNEVIRFLAIVHVNLFVLMSGYFNIKSKFKLSKVINLYLACIFYIVVIMIILSRNNIESFETIDYIRGFFLVDDFYWFIKSYIFLYMLSPFINKLIYSLKKKDYKRLLFASTFIISIIPYITGNRGLFINSGYSLYNFIYIYLIGAYIRLYPVRDMSIFKKFTDKGYRLLLLFMYFAMAGLNFCLVKTSYSLLHCSDILSELLRNIINEAFNYENPFVILQSIFLFLYFETLSFKSRIINKIATLVFGVYLVHEHLYLKKYLYEWLKIDNGPIYSRRFILYMFFIMILIFIVSAIIEFIRQKLFKFIHNRKISTKFRTRFCRYINDLGIKVSW